MTVHLRHLALPLEAEGVRAFAVLLVVASLSASQTFVLALCRTIPREINVFIDRASGAPNRW